MFVSLFNKGLDPRNVFLIGKCYSTDPSTYRRMLRLGVNLCPSSFAFEKNLSFDELYAINIKKFLIRNKDFLTRKKGGLIVVLDDGGELIASISSMVEQIDSKVVAVEQTSAGYEKIKNLLLPFPVVNIARSRAKLEFESPLIAHTATDQLLSKLRGECPEGKRALIIGNGAIGNATLNTIQRHFPTETIDCDPRKSSITSVHLRSALPDFDIVIGCTGREVLSKQEHCILKKGARLVSISSSDREFAAAELRKKVNLPLKCHDDFWVDGIKILNCGFPINFGGHSSLTDPKPFQLTRALLVAGIFHGILAKSQHGGILPLDEITQDMIIDAYSDMYHIKAGIEKRSIV